LWSVLMFQSWLEHYHGSAAQASAAPTFAKYGVARSW
jgi:hypothetical protein